jgi:hypothetical protein
MTPERWPRNSVAGGAPQLMLIREVFELFDTDGEQQLDEEELASAIFAMGFSQHGHAEVCCEIPPSHSSLRAGVLRAFPLLGTSYLCCPSLTDPHFLISCLARWSVLFKLIIVFLIVF